jgi:hypothetical protein
MDGLVADVVGPWASEKRERLRRYIDTYRSARNVFAVAQLGGTTKLATLS